MHHLDAVIMEWQVGGRTKPDLRIGQVPDPALTNRHQVRVGLNADH